MFPEALVTFLTGPGSALAWKYDNDIGPQSRGADRDYLVIEITPEEKGYQDRKRDTRSCDLQTTLGSATPPAITATMNNDQFRRLLFANAAKKDKDGASPPSSHAASSTPASLGSRLKSSIPMTPRSVAGGGGRIDFIKQLQERNQAFEKTAKKTRTSLPKGSKFAEGYVDRAKTRQEQEEEDERAARLKALEESFKKEEINQATYDRLRSEIAGGDLSSTHLVKGLDFKLLDRVRKGEDIFSEKSNFGEPGADGGEQAADPEEDADDVLDQEKTQKKGQLAPVSLLKAAREATTMAKEESSLGSKFKKIGTKKTPGTRIERDGKGREVMIITGEDGHERRKEKEAVLFYKQQQAELAKQEAEEEEKEVNIFEDAGSDYDPLAGLESDDSSDEEGAIEEKGEPALDAAREETKTETTGMAPPPKPSAPPVRNYFKDSKTGLTSDETYKTKTLAVDDPSFLAALKKANAATAAEKSEEEQKMAEREKRLKKKLQESNRDDDDMDLGFGSSRVEDEADGDADDSKFKFSEWRGGQRDDEDDEEGGGAKGGGKSSRKRGPKKRKGDKNSFGDVMKVIERNKAGGM
ncbi:hypothetical protein B0H67DRAFT_597376 [Lasiosphaeris hirsuta]|uniref:RED-like N-terminal domain-containing protein n=1 Tax=Lasiosphaeris hirsuta TaxID=260670 RepID=A0AA40BBZ8_9PEZI|nr:hypothetical protein B0H67DRAFT_597376 [Lasiosphaeris hirsuta]